MERVEEKDVRLSQQLPRAMAAEAEATREARAKVGLQKMKILSFFYFFGAFFALLDPDPDPQFLCGSGSNSSN